MDVQEALEHFANIPKIAGDAPDAARRRARLPQARPAVADALRRRGPADQARRELVKQGHRQDALHPRRADHRPALRRRPQAARGAARLHGAGQHGGRHRAQPRRRSRRPTGSSTSAPKAGAGGGRIVAEGTPEAGRRESPRATPGRPCRRVLDGPKPVVRTATASRRRPPERPEVVGRGARGDRRPGRAAAQPQGGRRRHAARTR